ncbi:MAG: hypothetical protein OR999_10370 [Arenicellales bacterium]|jgi:hypothetical protein|nr:hypothetical protein [Arenicellales bacterium]
MVPRLWSYQVELPARTILHLALGISIAALLILKLVIVRYFKHMEAKLASPLGICSTVRRQRAMESARFNPAGLACI